MIDKCKRFIRPRVALEELATLKGKQLEFNSLAEMQTIRSREIPDAVHVLYYDQVITYGQTNERANKVATYLKEKGVTKGDVVMTMILNAPEIYYTLFGAQKLGAIAGAINYMLKAPEIAYVLEDSRPKVVFVGSEYMEEFAKGYEESHHKPIVVEVVTGIDHGAHISEGTLGNILVQYPADECLVPQALDDPLPAPLFFGHHRPAQGDSHVQPERVYHLQGQRRKRCQ